MKSKYTAAELTDRELEIEQLAERIVDQRVLACQSSLVDELLKCQIRVPDDWKPSAQDTLFSYDDIENLYPDSSDWDEAECAAWIAEYCGANVMCDDDDLDRLREIVQDNAEPAEIFEWWLVESGLAEGLRQIGEPVLDNGYGTWWGRTCTGQAILSDGTIQRVAALWLSR